MLDAGCWRAGQSLLCEYCILRRDHSAWEIKCIIMETHHQLKYRDIAPQSILADRVYFQYPSLAQKIITKLILPFSVPSAFVGRSAI
jgi:hypothetical protein